MIWRISKALKSGPIAYDASPYLTEEDALAAIKKAFDAGNVLAADCPPSALMRQIGRIEEGMFLAHRNVQRDEDDSLLHL
jgi:hypothetical protein